MLQAIGPIWNTVPDTAGRILRRIKAVFDWCMVSGFRTMLVNGMSVTQPNPCESIRMALPKQNRTEGHHEALPFSELPDFIQKLRVSNSALAVKLAFEFLILTAARTSEVLEATWDEFDLKENEEVWTIPAARMKMKEPPKVPLSDRCVEILKLAKEFNDGAACVSRPLSRSSAFEHGLPDGAPAHGQGEPHEGTASARPSRPGRKKPRSSIPS